jgi:hypothetical protein
MVRTNAATPAAVGKKRENKESSLSKDAAALSPSVARGAETAAAAGECADPSPSPRKQRRRSSLQEQQLPPWKAKRLAASKEAERKLQLQFDTHFSQLLEFKLI